jgi:uncharacterized protein YcfJ
MEPSMNRSALFVLLATATAAAGVQAHSYTDNARVVGVEAQYENVSVPRQECRNDWVTEARPAGGRNYGGAVVGGLAGALLGNQVGRGHGREAATAVGAVVGALTGDNIANRGRWEQPYQPVAHEVTSCRTVSDVQSRVVGYRVDYEYRGQRFSTLMHDEPGAFVPVRVSVEPVGR